MFDKFPILAIETSQASCGVCIFFDDDKFYEINVKLKNAHAEKIFEIIDSVFKISGIQLSELGSIAVSAGPGSFTGLRIGMSAAKGIAFGHSLPIIPVPTFEALAFQISNQLDDNREFIIANKVNIEEVYFAKFKVKANNYIFVQELQIKKSFDTIAVNNDCLIFGNAAFSNISSERILPESYPKPEYIAKWTKCFGEEKVQYNLDFLQPNYHKEFTVRDIKK